MNNTIEKIVKKAVDNGWYIEGKKVIETEYNEGDDWIYIWKTTDGCCDLSILKECLIYNHTFAKAFWGKRHITIAIDIDGKPYYKEWKDKKFIKTHDIEPAWQYHMKNYVIMEKPLEYFKKFI